MGFGKLKYYTVSIHTIRIAQQALCKVLRYTMRSHVNDMSSTFDYLNKGLVFVLESV